MLAMDFNAKYYDRELLNLAAKESGFSEKVFEQNDERKAEAVRKTLEAAEPTAMVPATFLSTHKDWTLFLDADSASQIDPAQYA